MKYENKLGEWSDHMEQTWQDAKQFSTRLGREQELVDADGYESTIIAAASDTSGAKFAWVETREKETKPGYWDVTHTLRAAQDDEVKAKWELPTYNPFFGCEVGLLEWYGDQLVIVYREKHETLLAVFDTQTGNKGRLLPIDDDWNTDSGKVYFLSNELGLIETCSLPELQIGVPVPTGVDPANRQFVSKPGYAVDDFSSRIATLLFGVNPPQPLADVLIGSAAYRFWDSWPTPIISYGFRRRWNSPYWFPFYWHKSLSAEDGDQLTRSLARLGSKSFDDDAAEDYPYRMAAEHVCRAAEDWGAVCELDSLPDDRSCYFWVDWSQKEFRGSLSTFPQGFQKAYRHVVGSRSTGIGGVFGRLLRKWGID